MSTSSGSCFLVSDQQVESTSEKDKIAMIWHNRLGHPSARVLDKVLNIVDDHVTSRNVDFYNSCPLGKRHIDCFPGLSDFRANQPLELVYSDV